MAPHGPRPHSLWLVNQLGKRRSVFQTLPKLLLQRAVCNISRSVAYRNGALILQIRNLNKTVVTTLRGPGAQKSASAPAKTGSGSPRAFRKGHRAEKQKKETLGANDAMEKATLGRRLCNAVRPIGRTSRALAGYFTGVGCRAWVVAFVIKSIVPKYTPVLIVRVVGFSL